MKILVCILIAVIIIQWFILWKYQRQVRDICRQLSFLLKNDSNMLVTGNTGFGGLKELMEILNQLLLNRKKEHKMYLELKHCCVNQVLKQTIFSYYDEWTAKGIEPDIHITDKLLYIDGNETALQRVLQNVIKNALDHGANGIGISLEERNGNSLIRIWNEVNNPEKINPEKVFERFYKADTARSKTSSGLGLSIAKEFTERMHGKISAELTGNIFCIKIRFE